MVSCCLPHFDLGWESPAAPCKSQHCWQPKSAAAHSPGKKICEKGAELSLPICFLFSLHLFIHLFSVCLCHKIHVRRIFLLPSSLPPPTEDTFQCLSISFKRAFLQFLASPCCPSLLFCMNCKVPRVLSSHPCSSPDCNRQKDAWQREKSAERERKGIARY